MITQTLADMVKAKLSLPDNLKDKSIEYDSDVWMDNQASDIFIKPTATSGEGIKYLKIMALGGAIQAESVIEILKEHGPAVGHDSKYLAVVNAILDKSDPNEASKENIKKNIKAIHLLKGRIGLIKPMSDKSESLLDQYRLVGRVCESVGRMQSEHGEKLVKEREQIFKLTVGMKCLDASWHAAITLHREVQLMNGLISSEIDGYFPDTMRVISARKKWTLVRDIVDGPFFVEGWRDDDSASEEKEENKTDTGAVVKLETALESKDELDRSQEERGGDSADDINTDKQEGGAESEKREEEQGHEKLLSGIERRSLTSA